MLLRITDSLSVEPESIVSANREASGMITIVVARAHYDNRWSVDPNRITERAWKFLNLGDGPE